MIQIVDAVTDAGSEVAVARSAASEAIQACRH
jgi:hypothetical protein